MSIFVQREGETFGPFSREEAIAHLQEGTFSEDDFACTDQNLEGRPLKDLLNDGALAASPQEITAKQESVATKSNIFVQHDGEMLGPFSREEVIGHVRDGVLSGDDLACTEANMEGRPLKGVLEETDPALTPSEAIPAGGELAGAVPSLLDLQMYRESKPGREPQESPQSRRTLVLAAICMVCFLGGGIATYFAFKPNASKLSTADSATPSSHALAAASTNTPAPQASNPAVTDASQLPSATPLAVQPSASMPLADTAPSNPEIPLPADTAAAQNTEANPALNNPPPAQPVATAQKTPAPVLAAAHQIALPKPLPNERGKPRGNLWVADTATNPKAILVLCLPPNGNSEGSVKSASWQKFAKDNGLALAAIAFGSDQDMLKSDANNTRPGSAVENILLTGLHGYFGDKVPLIVYGREAGGTLAVSIEDWHPEIVKVWGAYSNQWPAQWPLAPQPGKISPPGILACDIETIKQGKTQVRDFFTAGRAQNKPWTMISLATEPKSRQQSLDAFFCDFVLACLAPGPGQNPGVLVGTESKNLFSGLDAMTRPKDATWLPNASMIEEWNSLMSAEELAGKPIVLQKDIATLNPKEPHLQMYLRLPVGAKSGKDVAGVLAYCSLDANEAAILATLSIQKNEKVTGDNTLANLIKFADAHNLAVLTWKTATVWNMKVSNEDMAHGEQIRFDESFDTIAAAWEKGVNQFASEINLPTKDYLLYGISRGAQWAHRLALRKPAYFLAVHVHIPSTFDIPTPDANRALWLLTTGEEEYGYESAKRFYRECSALGYPMIFKAIPGLGHNDSPVADNLTWQFFEYALSVRNIHDAHEMNLQSHVSMAGNQSIPPWIQSFRQPAFFGDLLNQDCYPGTQVSLIEPTLRVPLPTKELADAWNK